jgi:hypothetical protein
VVLCFRQIDIGFSFLELSQMSERLEEIEQLEMIENRRQAFLLLRYDE